MPVFASRFGRGLLVACLCVPALAGSVVAQRGGVRKPVKKNQADPPPVPAYTPVPLQALPLDQMPAVAPQVVLQDGRLTIVAHNCTLADVLKAIRKQTGADLDIPPSATERVVADLGPGSPRQVIADLLNGTHFNYVMVGSATDPTAVESIALTPKSGGSETTAATPSIRPGFPQRAFQQRAIPPVQGAPPPEAIGAQDADDAAEPPEEAADQADGQEDQPQTADQQNQGQQTPKTPEQLLQELQRQQQQQQQQGQQSGQPSQTPPGGLFPNQPPTQQAPPTKPD
jgi:hypothetical protein